MNISTYYSIIAPLNFKIMKGIEELPPGMINMERMKHEVFRVLKKRIDRQAYPKLTIDEFGLLSTLGMAQDPVIQKRVAEILRKDKSAILRLVNSLEQKELVKRAVKVDDKRKNYLVITPPGEKVLEQYRKIEISLTRELEQGINESDVGIFYKVIGQLKANAEKL